MNKRYVWLSSLVLMTLVYVAPVLAQVVDVAMSDSTLFTLPLDQQLKIINARVAEAKFWTNNLWMHLASALVFTMNLGFGCVESGLTRSKNAVNIFFKNVIVMAIGILTYAFVGFNLMYPGELAENWNIFGMVAKFTFGLSFDSASTTLAYNDSFTKPTDFLFQGMFAATAGTIVSGAVAERIRLRGFLIFATVFIAIVYPIVGSWTWQKGGWLYALNFHDFAGSTVVHSCGGWAALAGVAVLGARLGRFDTGKSVAILGHSVPLVTIGGFLLWLGWFGFNGGSVLSADPAKVSIVLVTTNLAAVSGVLSSMIASWISDKKPDLTMVLNGALGALVGITAAADTVTPGSSIVIGLISGVLVVYSVGWFNRREIDDPVGAISVHLVNGVWGTLAVGIFSTNSDYTLLTQIIGTFSSGAAYFVSAYIIFKLLDMTMGIRVAEDDERDGLDFKHHGMEAYPEAQNHPA